MAVSRKGTRFFSLRLALLVALSSFLLRGAESLVPSSRTQLLTLQNASRSNHESFERKLYPYNKCSHLGRNSLFTRGGSSSSNNISVSSRPLYSSSSSASNSEPSSFVPSSQYYLLLSSSIWRNIALETMSLFILRAIFQKAVQGTTSTVALCHTSHSKIILFLYKLMPILKQISLPLLSSACCILQFFLNAFFAGAGCAGFNTKLGPIRPYFVSILLFTSIQSFSMNGWRILQLFLSWCIALMPEIIHFKNELNTQHAVNDAMYDGLASVNCRKAVVELDIQDMGCVACINKIDATLRSSSDLGIQDAKSWLNGDGIKGGKAKIELILEDSYSDENTIELVVEEIVDLVKSSGFQCSLANVHVE